MFMRVNKAISFTGTGPGTGAGAETGASADTGIDRATLVDGNPASRWERFTIANDQSLLI